MPGRWTPTPSRPLRDFRLHPDFDSTETPVLPTPARPSVFHTTPHGAYYIRVTTHSSQLHIPALHLKYPSLEITTFVPGGSRTIRRDKAKLLVKWAMEARNAYTVEGRFAGESSERSPWKTASIAMSAHLLFTQLRPASAYFGARKRSSQGGGFPKLP